MEKTKYWIWFSRIKNLGSIKKQELLKKYKIEKIWNLKQKELMSIDGIGEKTAKEILNPKYKMGLENIINQMKKEKIRLINIDDANYPEKLKQIYDKPISLYVKGNVEILSKLLVAAIFNQNINYNLNYFYENNVKENNFNKVFPYFVMAGSQIVFISHDYETGLYVKDKNLSNYLKEEYDRISEWCSKFINFKRGIADLIEFYREIDQKKL